MRRSNFLIVALLFVMSLALALPAMASAPTVTPFKAVQQGVITSTEKMWTTEGGINLFKGRVNEGTVSLYIPDTSSSPAYIFTFYNVYNQIGNPETQHIIVEVDATWKYFDENGEVIGTFEGRIAWNFPAAHGVLHGTGIFDGQKLMFWRDITTPFPPTTWIGTLITN